LRTRHLLQPQQKPQMSYLLSQIRLEMEMRNRERRRPASPGSWCFSLEHMSIELLSQVSFHFSHLYSFFVLFPFLFMILCSAVSEKQYTRLEIPHCEWSNLLLSPRAIDIIHA
jgi:hypothetical protein